MVSRWEIQTAGVKYEFYTTTQSTLKIDWSQKGMDVAVRLRPTANGYFAESIESEQAR